MAHLLSLSLPPANGGLTTNEFLVANRPLIYFVYGLSFFLLGWSIWLQQWPGSGLRLAGNLPFLATFGILHGVAEWGHVFIPIQERFVPEVFLNLLYLVNLLLFAGSFLALFLFGSFLTSDGNERLSWLPLVPLAIFVVWLARFLIFPPPSWPQAIWQLVRYSEVWARYLLAVPGIVLSAVGLWRQSRQFREEGYPQLVPDLRGTGIAILAYGFFTGVLVPKANFFPANVINGEWLFELGMPVAVPRALCSAAITFYLMRTMRVFEAEQSRRLDQLDVARAAAEERERLGRQLHDGILQSIYATGLGLHGIRKRVASEPAEALHRLDMVQDRLGRIIDEIRAYIGGLEACADSPLLPVWAALREAVAEFRKTYGVPVRADIPTLPEGCLDCVTAQQVLYVVREALANVGRHAAARNVTVQLRAVAGNVCVLIADDGRGFDLPGALAREGHFGLRILHRRVESVGGTVRIESASGQGTRVELTVPVRKEEVAS